MIADRSFTREWLLTVNEDLGWNRQETQLKNLEKAIAAFHLVELLVDTKQSFIFKGGTSLLLLLQKIYRLSVDIDIIIEKPIRNIGNLFTQICSISKLFTRFERQDRETDAVSGAKHFKFFYQPFADANEGSYILLDLYEAAIPYAKTLELELVSDILYTQGLNVFVHVPDVDSILGDKLTAFAPDTIGIPLSAEPGHRPKRIEVLKQLFDIGNLFDLAGNIDNILTTYNTIARHEIKRHGLGMLSTDSLKDSLRYAYIIGHGGKVDKVLYDNIAKGYKDFNKFVSDLSFDETHAVLAAAKVAYLVSVLLLSGKTLDKYDEKINMETWNISEIDCIDFNNYKYSNPEAFFYWYKTLLMNKSM